MIESYNLNRFLDAQKEDYEYALKEIKRGRKVTHWMWYIFPQVAGLGKSAMSQFYEIKSLEEAKAYLDHAVLGSRLKEITMELLSLSSKDSIGIFGEVDALKLRSSMTLFFYVSSDFLFQSVIDQYFDGIMDERTICICNNWPNKGSF